MNKQTIDVNLISGVNTKADEKFVEAGSLLKCENGIFVQEGSIKKRNGYTALSQSSKSDSDSITTITSGSALATLQDELLLFDKTKVYSYIESSEFWKSVGEVSSVGVESRNITDNNYYQEASDYGEVDGLGVFAWVDSRGGVRATLTDEETKAVIRNDYSLGSDAYGCRVVSLADSVLVFYDAAYNAANRAIKIAVIKKNKPLTSVVETAYIDLNASYPLFDATAHDSTRAMLVYFTSSGVLRFTYIGEDGIAVTGGAYNSATVTPTYAPRTFLSVCCDGSNTAVLFNTASNGVRSLARTYNLASALYSDRQVENVSATIGTGIFNSATEITFFYEITAAADYNRYVKKNTVSTSGTVGTASVFKRSVWLATRPFQRDSDDFWVGLAHQSTLQATYVLARGSDGYLAAKWAYGVAGSVRTVDYLPHVWETDLDVFKLANPVKTRLISENGDVFTQDAIAAVKLDFTASPNYQTAELGEGLLIAGGLIQQYDGAKITEQGFLLYPENLSYSETTGGSIDAGDYLYKAVFEWKDARGQIERSGTSVPLTATASSGSRKITVTIPTLRLTNKSDVSIALYRTTVNSSSPYYRVSSVTSLTLNDLTTDSVSIVDTTADATLQSNELLYTYGTTGELEHIAAPGGSLILAAKNRVWVAGLEDRKELVYSLEHVAGEAVTFTDSFTLSLNDDITALSDLDDKIVVFMKNRIAYTGEGLGPDSTGGGSYFDLRYITSDVGTSNPNSVVKCDLGVMFQSAKGIYLLDRALQVIYIGAPVEAYNSKTITSATVLPDVNQIRFTTDDDTCLVFDTFFKQWSTFTNHTAVDAVAWQDAFVMLRSEGLVLQETAGVYYDNNKPIKLLLETGWFKFGGPQVLQRLYWINVLGTYRSEHRMSVDVAFDYRNFYAHTHELNTADAFDDTTYGDGVYGDGVFGGTDDNVYRFSFRPTQSRCNAVKLRFRDINPTGESYSINNLSFVIGINNTRPKIGSSKII